jgi:hypothetical protein
VITSAAIGARFRIGSLTPALLRAGAAAAAPVPTGTKISFTLSEPATVSFTFARKQPGRRVRGRCVRQTRRNRRAKRCNRLTPAGSFTLPARQGANRVRFQGRFGTRKLKPGRYVLTLRAIDAAGNSSRRVSRAFKLLRARRHR